MKWIVGRYLRAVAALVYLQYIGSQLYAPVWEGLSTTIWSILDPLMVLGLIIVVVGAYQRKRNVDGAADDGVSREYLEANGSFYLGVALLVGLLSNWLGFQFGNPEETEALLWIVIDITTPLLLFSASIKHSET